MVNIEKNDEKVWIILFEIEIKPKDLLSMILNLSTEVKLFVPITVNC
jgi:hypothetical protein